MFREKRNLLIQRVQQLKTRTTRKNGLLATIALVNAIKQMAKKFNDTKDLAALKAVQD